MSGEAGFHRSDGAGYRFVTDQLLPIDARNPQISARLLGCFALWRRFANPFRGLMQGELTRIVQTPGLSRDSYEVASKLLADPAG